MLIPIIKFAAGLAIAVAGYYAADRITKNKTGRHIHEHVAHQASLFWNLIREKILSWTDKHPAISKIARFFIATMDKHIGRVIIFAQWNTKSGALKKATVVKETTMSIKQYNKMFKNKKKKVDITDKVAIAVYA